MQVGGTSNLASSEPIANGDKIFTFKRQACVEQTTLFGKSGSIGVGAAGI